MQYPSHTNISSHTWILDSKANDHVCSSIDLFNYYFKIKHIKITVPNGKCTMVHYAGNIDFSPIFYLNHVLFAPDFNLNLISISKLCKYLKYFVVFSIDQCILQEMNTKRMIGLVSKENGLYKLHLKKIHFEARVSSHQIDPKLKFPTQANTCHASSPLPISYFQNIVIPKYAIWHFRLGHMSSKRIAQMSKLYSSFEYDNNSTCDICHLAKQRKLPYHLSNFIASHNFELFHFDIWGPLATPSIQNHKYFLLSLMRTHVL